MVKITCYSLNVDHFQCIPVAELISFLWNASWTSCNQTTKMLNQLKVEFKLDFIWLGFVAFMGRWTSWSWYDPKATWVKRVTWQLWSFTANHWWRLWNQTWLDGWVDAKKGIACNGFVLFPSKIIYQIVMWVHHYMSPTIKYAKLLKSF